jgi:hypothetical protein
LLKSVQPLSKPEKTQVDGGYLPMSNSCRGKSPIPPLYETLIVIPYPVLLIYTA